MKELTALEGFRSMVRRYPETVALRTVDGRATTYAELDERSDALAAALEERLPGERLAVVSGNGSHVIEAMIAAQKRGLANAQLSTRGAVGELISMTETAGAAGLLFDEVVADRATTLAERLDLDVVIGVDDAAADVDGAETYADVVESGDPAAVPEPATDPPESAIFYTSGTTSAPKAILVDGWQSYLAGNQPALEMSLTARDVAIVCSPWYHMVTSQAWIWPHLFVGAELVIQPTFEPPQTLELMEEHGVTGLLAVPTQLEAMLEAQESVGADVTPLSYIRTGGAVVPDSLIERTRAEFTEGVFNTYGLTEGVGNLAFAYPEDQHDHPGTIGKGSYLWDLRVVEAADPPEKPDPEAVIESNGVGEIIGKSLQMTDGYIGRPEAEEEAFVDGWLRTGDVAQVDEDGYLVVIDRVDNMIISGGENVYPEEVQQALKDHPAVRDAGVVGLPDERWGHLVAAAIDARESVTEDELDAHCKDHDTLADFKRPRRYVFVDELPRTATGTLVKDEVAALFDGE